MKAFLRQIRQIGRFIARGLFKALFPNKCMMCDGYFSLYSSSGEQILWFREHWADLRLKEMFPDQIGWREALMTHLCPDCVKIFVPVTSPICPKCGMMSKDREGGDRLCPRCRAGSHRFGKARACGVYDKNLQKLIRMYKYTSTAIFMGECFGLIMFVTYLKHWDKGEIDIIIPVPLHIKRFRKRGFNQAWLMFSKWPVMAKIFDIDLSYLQFDHEILKRKKATKTQANMDQEQRRENVRDAFYVTDPSKVKGKRFLLVDDVLTTGSTADECARVLLESGAERMDLLTLAQTLRKLGT